MERIAAYTASDAESVKERYVYDVRGSVIQTITGKATEHIAEAITGPEIQSYAYTPYGERIGTKASGYGYNGGYYDAATGMVNLRARQYEPAQMRFSQPDVVRGYALNPQTENRYAYCVNNPVMYADPSGESYTSGVGGAWSRTASILIDDYVQVAPSTVNRLVRAAKQTVGNGGASASERRIKASIKAAQEEIRRLNIFRRTYDIERELIGRRACAQLMGDEARAAEYGAELAFVQAHTYQDILFLVGIDYLGVELSMEVRLSILERLKANEGGLEAEELQELGLYTEYRNVAAEMAALLEASYCGSRFEQTLYSIDELHRADRQAEVQMFLRFFGNMTIMASVQDYNAAGSAIREPGATVATKGYESGPRDGKPFNYTGTRYATDASKPAGGGDILAELDATGVKYNADDIVLITKDTNGNIRWLETGNARSGLEHITERHGEDFARRGITDIPGFVKTALESQPVKTGMSASGPFADYLINGYTYRIAYGTNGYIVTFFPLTD